jgi:hypothetical protein
MAKKSEAKGAERTKKASNASPTVAQIITVVEGDKTPHDELMKLPKAQIVRSMAVPENKTRFLVDVDNQTTRGKMIVALMETLCDGNAAAINTVTGILEALAGMVVEKPTPEK